MTKPLKTVGSSYVPEKPAPDTADHVGIGNAIDTIGASMFSDWQIGETGTRWEHVVEKLTASLQGGDLTGGYLFGSVVSGMEAGKWAAAEREWFRRGKFKPFGGPSYAWLFIGRRSLKSYLRKHWPPTTSAPFDFDHTEKRWRLFDAVIWVATGGKATTTGDIANNSLDDVGARILFARLDDMGFNAPKVTGISPGLQIRVPLVAAWERTHTGWLGNEGHRVSFYQASDGQIQADLTQHRHIDPSYLDLRIERDDLLSLFPAKERDEGPSGGPRTGEAISDEARVADLFFEMMDASPTKRTHSKNQLGALALARWPSLSSNALRRARAAAMKRGKGRFAAWGAGGKPTG